MEKLPKIHGKIVLKIDQQIVLKLTKFVPKLRAHCMVVVYKCKIFPTQTKFGWDFLRKNI